MKPITVIGLAVLLLFSSCSGSLYSHYPYVKQAKKPARENTRQRSRITRVPGSFLQHKLPEPAGMGLPVDTARAAIPPAIRPVKAIPAVYHPGTVAPADSTLAAEPGVNKKAKLAFWGSFVTIGSIALAFISPWLLIVTVLLNILMVIYAFWAIREIRTSGEYGRPKAEFALFLMVPMLLLTIGIAIFLLTCSGWLCVL